MLSRTRVTGSIDMARLGEALARPGMDPRVWGSLAIVDAFNVSPEGVFADVTLVPSNTQETVRVGPVYAGNGFGLYAPLAVEDEVLVVFPSGDPNIGGVVAARLWSKADAVPTSAQTNQADLVLVVEDNKNLRIETGGTGSVILEPKGAGKVEVGGENNTDPMVLGQQLSTLLNTLLVLLDTHVHDFPAGSGTPTGPAQLPVGSPGQFVAQIQGVLPSILATKGTVK